MIHRPSKRGARHDARAGLARWATFVCAGVIATVSPASAARAAQATARLSPTDGATNQADLTLTVLGNPAAPATSTVTDGSTLELTYDTGTHLLTLSSGTLLGSNVLFNVGLLLHIAANDITVVYDPSIPGAVVPVATVDPGTGAFSGMEIAVRVTAKIAVNGGSLQPVSGITTITMDGNLAYDPGTGSFSVTDFGGPIEPIAIPQIGNPVLAGSIALNFSLVGVFANGFESGDCAAWSAASPAC